MRTKLLVALTVVSAFAAGDQLGKNTYDIGLSREDRLVAQYDCPTQPGGCVAIPAHVLKSLIMQLMRSAPGGSNGRL